MTFSAFIEALNEELHKRIDQKSGWGRLQLWVEIREAEIAAMAKSVQSVSEESPEYQKKK